MPIDIERYRGIKMDTEEYRWIQRNTGTEEGEKCGVIRERGRDGRQMTTISPPSCFLEHYAKFNFLQIYKKKINFPQIYIDNFHLENVRHF